MLTQIVKYDDNYAVPHRQSTAVGLLWDIVHQYFSIPPLTAAQGSKISNMLAAWVDKTADGDARGAGSVCRRKPKKSRSKGVRTFVCVSLESTSTTLLQFANSSVFFCCMGLVLLQHAALANPEHFGESGSRTRPFVRVLSSRQTLFAITPQVEEGKQGAVWIW